MKRQSKSERLIRKHTAKCSMHAWDYRSSPTQPCLKKEKNMETMRGTKRTLSLKKMTKEKMTGVMTLSSEIITTWSGSLILTKDNALERQMRRTRLNLLLMKTFQALTLWTSSMPHAEALIIKTKRSSNNSKSSCWRPLRNKKVALMDACRPTQRNNSTDAISRERLSKNSVFSMELFHRE